MSLSRAYTRASYVFSFSSITSITIYVNYHADKELDSDRRRDRRVIVVIEERFFNVKIRDRKSRLMLCENQIASLRQRQPTAYALQSVQGTIVEDLFDGSLSDVISCAAGMVAAAIGDATTPMYSGCSGGSSSDDKPKKDDVLSIHPEFSFGNLFR